MGPVSQPVLCSCWPEVVFQSRFLNVSPTQDIHQHKLGLTWVSGSGPWTDRNRPLGYFRQWFDANYYCNRCAHSPQLLRSPPPPHKNPPLETPDFFEKLSGLLFFKFCRVFPSFGQCRPFSQILVYFSQFCRYASVTIRSCSATTRTNSWRFLTGGFPVTAYCPGVRRHAVSKRFGGCSPVLGHTPAGHATARFLEGFLEGSFKGSAFLEGFLEGTLYGCQ